MSEQRLRGRKGVDHRRAVRAEEPWCRHCLAQGRRTATSQVDHIVPLFKGGSNARSNMQGLCDDHHRIKSAADTGKRASVRLVIGLDGWTIE